MIIIEKEHFEDYIIKYQHLIITICLSFTKNYFDAEDLAQQTFLYAYKNLDEFDGNNFKAWLTTIAANKCKDHIKCASNRLCVLSDEEYKYIEDDMELPEEIIVKSENEKRVEMLCGRLKEPYRTVSLNYFCRNIKLSDMAKSTGKSLRTLETQLYRAKKLLKALWKEENI